MAPGYPLFSQDTLHFFCQAHFEVFCTWYLVEVRLDLDVDADCCLEVVVAVEADVRLDDRHEPLVLADERVSVSFYFRMRRVCGRPRKAGVGRS